MDRLRGPRKRGWLVFVVVVALAGAVAGVLGGSILHNRHKAASAQASADEAKRALNAERHFALELRLTTFTLCRSDGRSVKDCRKIAAGVILPVLTHTQERKILKILGAPGPAGALGPKGVQGLIGKAGARGHDGKDGAQGAQGPKGNTGSVGPAGPRGANGATGPRGSAGPQGAQGPPGPPGAVGPPSILCPGLKIVTITIP
jgi:Collagen triple helix repeat (20 copies)